MKKYCVILVLIYWVLPVNSQVIIKYQNTYTQKYGLKDSITNKLITAAHYESIRKLNDTLFIVGLANYYSTIIDYQGNQMFEPAQTIMEKADWKCFEHTNNKRNGLKLLSYPYYYPDSTIQANHKFYINLKNECLPSDYFPCPVWQKTNYDSVPDYLICIQKGEKYIWFDEIDSAILMCEKAIKLEPENPANYFWGANIFLRHYFFTTDLLNTDGYINSENSSQLSQYHSWIINCLNKAEKFENNLWFSKEIQKAKRKFYKHSYQDKEKLEEAKRKIKELRKMCKNNG